MLQGPAPSCFWVLSGICVLWDFIFIIIFFMSFLWVIEKSLQKTLVTNQLELKECGVSGGHTITCGLVPGTKPCSLKREGPGLLSFPPQLLAFCAGLQASSPASSLLCPGLLSAFGGVPDL